MPHFSFSSLNEINPLPEELILAEERTSDETRKHIVEGNLLWSRWRVSSQFVYHPQLGEEQNERN